MCRSGKRAETVQALTKIPSSPREDPKDLQGLGRDSEYFHGLYAISEVIFIIS